MKLTTPEIIVFLGIFGFLIWTSFFKQHKLVVSAGVCIDVGDHDFTIHDIMNDKTYTIEDPNGFLNFPTAGDTVVYQR